MEKYGFDEDFDYFLEKFGEPENCEKCDDKVILEYQNKLPEQLFVYWRGVGWCGYHSGLFWMTNPKDYEATLETWFKDTVFEGRDDLSVIARTAFGELHVWAKGKGEVMIIDPNLIVINYFSETDSENFNAAEEDEEMCYFWGFTDIESIDYSDKNDNLLFDRALKKFGVLQSNEQYGYKLNPQIGGDELFENIDKMNIFTYHNIAAQLKRPQIVSIIV